MEEYNHNTNPYNIHLVKGNQVEKVYVFKGNNTIDTEKYNHYKNVEYIDFEIYGDDTIQRVKEKIIKLNDFDEYSIRELFMFSYSKQNFKSDSIYKKITNNDEIFLTRDIANTFLYNINDSSSEYQSNKSTVENPNIDVYNESQFESLQFWQKDVLFMEAVGQKLIYKHYYPFITNPYFNDVKDKVLESNAQNIISTQNNNLLMKNTIVNNNIFICLVEDVLEHANENLSEEYYIKLYYPNLYAKNIYSLEDLRKKRIYLKEEENKNIDIINKYNTVIDFFHNLNRDSNISKHDLKNNKNSGIKDINFTIFMDKKIEMPLELLFKTINSKRIIL